MTETGTAIEPPGATREVAEGVFAVSTPFWGYPLTLYFLRSGDRWAVVDTGIATTPAEFIAPFLAERGGLESLELVLGTHGHVDHVGGNGALKAMAPHARFALHERDLGWAENVDRHIAQLYAYGEPEAWQLDADVDGALRGALGDPAAIDHILGDEDEVVFGDGRRIAVTHVGGHAPGHVVFGDVATGTVFCGDVLQGPGALNAESGLRDFPMYRTMHDYLAALETVRGLGAEPLCTAHAGVLTGAAIDAGVNASRDWALGFHELLRELVHRERSFTLAEMVAAVSAARPEHTVSLQIHVTTAEHLDALTRSGELRPSIADGIKRWTATGA
jgi:glyoxylase-like metal-dependent hydrolase (beta-lactamase superfamily II)